MRRVKIERHRGRGPGGLVFQIGRCGDRGAVFDVATDRAIRQSHRTICGQVSALGRTGPVYITADDCVATDRVVAVGVVSANDQVVGGGTIAGSADRKTSATVVVVGVATDSDTSLDIDIALCVVAENEDVEIIGNTEVDGLGMSGDRQKSGSGYGQKSGGSDNKRVVGIANLLNFQRNQQTDSQCRDICLNPNLVVGKNVRGTR